MSNPQKITLRLTNTKPRLSFFSAEIRQAVAEHDKVLIVAPLGTGKTYLYLNELLGLKADTYDVNVTPNLSQVYQTESKYKGLINLECQCTGRSMTGQGTVVITTPDSLPRVMGKIGNEPIVLCVDEIHEKVTTRQFREAFRHIDEASKCASKIIHMTATPQPLIDEYYDCIIEIKMNPKEHKIPCKIVCVEDINASVITQMSLNLINSGRYVQLYNDNKVMNSAVVKNIKKEIGEKAETIQIGILEDRMDHIGGDTTAEYYAGAESAPINEIIAGRYPTDLKFFATTSAIKAGVNIDNPVGTTPIIVCDTLNFDYSQLLQTIGRNRNKANIDMIYVLVKYHPNQKPFTFGSLKQIYKAYDAETLDVYTKHVINYSKLLGDRPSATSLSASCAVWDDKANMYVRDMDLVRAMAYRHWCGCLLANPCALAHELSNNGATALDVSISILQNFHEIEEFEAVHKAKKEEKKDKFDKAIKALQKKLEEKEYRYVEEIVVTTLDKIGTIIDAEQRKICKLYHENMSQCYEKLLKDLQKNLDKTYIEASKMAIMDRAECRELLKQQEAKKLNREYNNESGVYEIAKRITQQRKFRNKEAEIHYTIRDTLQVVEHKRGRITKKLKDDIIEYMLVTGLYPFCFKTTDNGKEYDHKKTLKNAHKRLDADLSRIYNFVEKPDKNGIPKPTDRISSVKL